MIEEGKIKMGTAWLLTANAIQAFGIKTILGSFFVMLVVLAVHANVKHSQRTATIAFLIIVGIVTIGSLVLFSLALDTMTLNPLGGNI